MSEQFVLMQKDKFFPSVILVKTNGFTPELTSTNSVMV